MSLVTIVMELIRFTKDYLRRILMISAMIALLVVGGRYFVNRFLHADTAEAYQYLSHVYQQEPASFQVIVTMEDGSLFSTAAVFDDYFSTPSVIQKIEKQTGISFGKWLEAEKQLEMYKTNTFRGGLAGIRDASSNVLTLRFLVGQSAEENLKIAQAYAQLVEERQLPFLANNTVTIIRPAELGEMIPVDLIEEIPTDATLTPYQSKEAKGSLIYGVLGLMIGFVVSLLWSLFDHYRKGKISYAFDYAWSINDQHYLYQRAQSKESLEKLIQTPQGRQRVVLRQQKHDSSALDLPQLEKEWIQLGHLNQLKAEGNPDEIVILLDANLTDKDWYQEQRLLASLYPSLIKIIQIS